MTPHYFLLLQINDALFPIGSYTQSYGLETYVQKNRVLSVTTAEQLLTAQIRQSILYSELLPIKLAYTLSKEKNVQGLADLERLSKVARTPKELREASQKLGNRFVRTVEGLPVDFDLSFFSAYGKHCKGISLSYPVAYGVFCATAEIPLEDVLAHFLYSQVSGFVTNCVKLIPLSQTDGQKLLTKIQSIFPSILAQLDILDENDLFSSCPALDIRSMEHEQLYSRLYMS